METEKPHAESCPDPVPQSDSSVQRERAAWLASDVDPLYSEVAERLLERFQVSHTSWDCNTSTPSDVESRPGAQDVARDFPRVLVLGGALDAVARHLFKSARGVQAVTFADTSPGQLAAAAKQVPSDAKAKCTFTQLQHDEQLPFQHGSFDAVIACLGLHWRNDLPGVLLQSRKCLVPDGLLLAALMGGNSLQELRVACALAEQERQGGLSARVSPLAQVRDAGNLLGRAGLALPAVDVDTITARYASPVDAVTHLRVLGETNACITRKQGPLPRDTALAAAAAMIAYSGKNDGPRDGDDEGDVIQQPQSPSEVCLTWQVVYMAGWAPDTSQPSAKKRGSATASFSDLAAQLGTLPDKGS